MRVILYLSSFFMTLSFFSCKNDVASALLKGEQVEYKFTNAELSERFVDEGLVSQFSLISNNAGSEAKIEALYIGSQDRIKTDTIILYLHGNSPSMNDYWQLTVDLANVGGKHNYGVMMFDYRGFGNSEGQSESIEDLVADAEACITWLEARGLTKDRLAVYGYSLGAMPAAHLAAEPSVLEIEKVVLDAPQTTGSRKVVMGALDGLVTWSHADRRRAAARRTRAAHRQAQHGCTAEPSRCQRRRRQVRRARTTTLARRCGIDRAVRQWRRDVAQCAASDGVWLLPRRELER